jgi:hypothetical protein
MIIYAAAAWLSCISTCLASTVLQVEASFMYSHRFTVPAPERTVKAIPHLNLLAVLAAGDTQVTLYDTSDLVAGHLTKVSIALTPVVRKLCSWEVASHHQGPTRCISIAFCQPSSTDSDDQHELCLYTAPYDDVGNGRWQTQPCPQLLSLHPSSGPFYYLRPVHSTVFYVADFSGDALQILPGPVSLFPVYAMYAEPRNSLLVAPGSMGDLLQLFRYVPSERHFQAWYVN